MFSKKRKIIFKDIDPDEIFVDSSNLPKFNTGKLEGNIERAITKKAGFGLIIISVLIFFLFITKLWSLEIKNNSVYVAKSENNRLRHAVIFSERGKILDRNGLVLASNENNDSNPEFNKRKYGDTEGIGNIIGFVKYPKKDNMGFFYQTEIMGMDGVEKAFNQKLQGRNGVKIVEVNALNEINSENIFEKPKNGEDIKLSIDAELSKKLNDFIKKTAAERNFEGGVAGVMDVETGEIIALTSYPEYDPQILTDGKNNATLKAYSDDKRKPYLNRPVNGLYTPGSIVKPFIAIGALNEKIINPEKKILSTGSISIPNEYDPEKKSVFNDWKAHGLVDMRKALAVSSNVYFFEIGGGFEDQVGLGIGRIEKYLRLFGFGSPLEDPYLAGESGIIPNPEWKEKNFLNDPWRIGDTYNTSIGQYGVQVTLVQALRAVGAIANKGKLIEPTIIFGDGSRPISASILGIPAEYFSVVQEGLRQGVLEGTASGLNISQVKIAAKNGTAEIGTKKKLVNSWVTGFFPYEKPRFAFVALMEKGPRENTVGALYVMRQFIEWLLVYKPEYTKTIN
jgi:penicillin-binding protein 2